ncbi:hypothetical protein LXL04_032235 [Taraxacum kok-saghyz]
MPICFSVESSIFHWVLSPKYFNFPFPITLTMIHMGFSGAVAFLLVRVFKNPLFNVIDRYATCVVPISAFFASSLWFGNTAYLHISVAFIQMLKALMPVATLIMAVLCGTDKLRWDVLLNMLLVSVGVVISSYGEIHFNVIGTLYQVTGIFAEALRLVLTQVLLQKKGLTLNPITSLYYIAPCRTGAVTIRVAGVLKDWILIALSTVIFPESAITGLNIIGYAIALCGVVMYNYIKVKDVKASQNPPESVNNVERMSNDDDNVRSSNVDEEAPLMASSRVQYCEVSCYNDDQQVTFLDLPLPIHLHFAVIWSYPVQQASTKNSLFMGINRYATCVVPISAFFASSLWFGNTAYLHISVAFIQMLKALIIGRTGAVTIRVAGVLKDWILIALSTVIFPESAITGLNIIGYAIALIGVVMYNYIKVKDVKASQNPPESIPERLTKEWKLEKKSSDNNISDEDNTTRRFNSMSDNGVVDEEAPLIASSRLSYIARSQLSSRDP